MAAAFQVARFRSNSAMRGALIGPWSWGVGQSSERVLHPVRTAARPINRAVVMARRIVRSPRAMSETAGWRLVFRDRSVVGGDAALGDATLDEGVQGLAPRHVQR